MTIALSRRAILLTFAAFACLLAPATAALAVDHTKDTIETVKKNLAEQKAILLDVREKEEWDAGHLKDAKLAPISKLKEGADVKEFAKDVKKGTIIYCHCKAGRRAQAAAELLQKAGYEVRPLKQGYDELLKAGLPKAE